VDAPLPVWARPHSFWQLRQGDWPRPVFTFGLAMIELHLLRAPNGVRHVGERWGYEWLPELSHAVQREVQRPLPPSALEAFLRDKHGFESATVMNMTSMSETAKEAGLPTEEMLAGFAEHDGRLIQRWAMNAFNGLETKLPGWARTRERVESGYQDAALRRLANTAMPRELVAVHTIEGKQRWAARYASLYQRVALELEDLATRRPRMQRCPLCQRPYIPIRPGQRVCATSIWDTNSRRSVARCLENPDVETVTDAESEIHTRQRKANWARMNRTRARYGHSDPRTQRALQDWQQWQTENPPPRPRGRPSSATPMAELPHAQGRRP
jgi:hypothetical protein